MRWPSRVSQNCRDAGLVERCHHWRLLAALEHAGEKTLRSAACWPVTQFLAMPSGVFLHHSVYRRTKIARLLPTGA